MNCTDCKHAKWVRTDAGRLHPSGEGCCMYEVKIPQLPACMYWIRYAEPRPMGGFINRHEELKTQCAYYAKAERMK